MLPVSYFCFLHNVFLPFRVTAHGNLRQYISPTDGETYLVTMRFKLLTKASDTLWQEVSVKVWEKYPGKMEGSIITQTLTWK